MRTFIIFAALVAASIAHAADKKLTGPQIKAAFTGKAGTWSSTDGKTSGNFSFTADTESITGNFPGFSEDKGKWWVKGNLFCNQFAKLRSGKEACQEIIQTGDKTYKFGTSSTVTLN
ncbi:hypothetical protein [Alsobacter sp. R-9]